VRLKESHLANTHVLAATKSPDTRFFGHGPSGADMLELERDMLTNGRGLAPAVKRHLELEYLPSYLSKQRWFAGKDAGPPAVEIQEVIPTDANGGPILTIIRTYGEQTQSYFLPIGVNPAHSFPPDLFICQVKLSSGFGYLVDAFEDDVLLSQMMSNLEKAADDGSEAWKGFSLKRSLLFPSGIRPDAIERMGGEQSNSSVRFGNAMLKAYRKLEPGVHPELELGRYLSLEASYRNAPRVLGSLETTAPAPVTLCIFHEIIANHGTAWDLVCELLVGRTDSSSGDNRQRLEALATRLGDRTASLHNALASGTKEPFSSEPISASDLRGWMEDICRNANAALDNLKESGSELCRRLMSRREELLTKLRRLSPSGEGSYKSRVHGDLHLGQVLVTAGDVFIIDFEGEPLRTFAERRSKYPPMKDIAGMLRSFDYALANTTRDTSIPGNLSLIEGAKHAFLAGYCCAADSFPADRKDAESLLNMFLLDKIFYEIRYELANRPDWVEIPVRGALAILDSRAL
jgi:trehalose synthase-fused probable maltokinase